MVSTYNRTDSTVFPMASCSRSACLLPLLLRLRLLGRAAGRDLRRAALDLRRQLADDVQQLHVGARPAQQRDRQRRGARHADRDDRLQGRSYAGWSMRQRILILLSSSAAKRLETQEGQCSSPYAATQPVVLYQVNRLASSTDTTASQGAGIPVGAMDTGHAGGKPGVLKHAEGARVNPY
jgi:hypothetical protein